MITNYDFLKARQEAGDLVGFSHEDGTEIYGLIVDLTADFITGDFSVTFRDPKTTVHHKIYLNIEELREAL